MQSSTHKKILIANTLVLLLLNSCATYNLQYNNSEYPKEIPKKTVAKTFYLVGDAGNASQDISTLGLEAFQEFIQKEDTNGDYLIYLGDNIYQKGMPAKEASDRALSEHRIDVQIDAAKEFDGEVMFIPGNHDWYNDGLLGLKRQEKYIRKKLDHKHSFLPSKGCPIKSITVDDQIQMIVLDTQWYLVNWDKHPTINDNCEIKTREKFLAEVAGELKKHDGKTILLIMHHPMFTHGHHGGKFSFKDHIFPSKKKIPLPVLGSLALQMRSQGGVTAQDVSNVRYNQLMRRLASMARGNDKIILASGHEHSLQYIDNDGLKQIVSGSGSKTSPVNLDYDGYFAYPAQGFAVLDVYTDGSSNVRFYANKERKTSLVYQTEVHPQNKTYELGKFEKEFDQEISASIYTKEETEKSKGYQSIWGDHYRYVYGKKVKFPIATLDTLKGGFTIDRQGGGQVTRSLKLVDPEGKRYSLRAMRKSVVQFLQKGVFVNTYLEDSFEDTFTEELLADFYTSSYPYAFLAVGGLADAIGVYHANPEVLYVPKHKELGKYNETFGDELYFLEERPGKEFKHLASFGKPDDIEGTDDLLKNLRKDEKYSMDEAFYIKTRLFDMLLGDWDRHPDQWRWARFDKDDKSVYRPIPKDRDQVFSNYDGTILDVIKLIVPMTRRFQVYDGELKNIRWISESARRLDLAFTSNSTRDVWLAQAAHIKNNLTDQAVEKAFQNLPEELQDDVVERIKGFVKQRRDHIEIIADKYYEYLSDQVIVKGTDKDDFFEVTREDGKTHVKVSRIKKGEPQKPFYERTILSSETDEIWIYGLDDDDRFEVKGKGKKPIRIRIIGGQNNDEYAIENGKKVRVYDYRTKPNTVKKKNGAKFHFSDSYHRNVYDFDKHITKTNTLTPMIGFNPDDGMNVNINDTYTVKGFEDKPNQYQYTVKAAYFFATEGYDLSLRGGYTSAIGNWDLHVQGRYTSENYAQNFFGFGNDTENLDEDLGLDYNRVKTSIWSFHSGLTKRGQYGGQYGFELSYEGIEVQDSDGRFVSSGVPLVEVDDQFFDRKYFAGIGMTYQYKSLDNPANPTRGMLFKLTSGTKLNVDDSERIFGYVNPRLGFYNALSKNKKLVLRTEMMGQFVLGDQFEFYQGATLGGVQSLRGYREERFLGERALAMSADMRYSFKRFKTALLPLQIGVYTGYDYGRVWLDAEDSNNWHDSVGGGLWINAVDTVAGQLGLFHSDDGLRFTFTFGIGF